MRKIKFTETVTAYPDGATPVTYAAGDEIEVGTGFAADYADLMIAKGHAVEAQADAAPEPSPTINQEETHA